MVPMEQKGKHDIGLLFVYHKYEKRRKASGKTADQCMYVCCLYVWCLYVCFLYVCCLYVCCLYVWCLYVCCLYVWCLYVWCLYVWCLYVCCLYVWCLYVWCLYVWCLYVWCLYVWCLYVWCLTRTAPGGGRVCMRGACGRCWAGGRRQTWPGAAPCWGASSHAPGQASPAAGSWNIHPHV